MSFLKTFVEITASLSVVIGWGYVALTLPEPAGAASAPSATQPASSNSAAVISGPLRALVAQR